MTERTLVLAVLGAATALAALITAFIYRDELVALAAPVDDPWHPNRL